jgi:hypothetical protein
MTARRFVYESGSNQGSRKHPGIIDEIEEIRGH